MHDDFLISTEYSLGLVTPSHVWISKLNDHQKQESKWYKTITAKTIQVYFYPKKEVSLFDKIREVHYDYMYKMYDQPTEMIMNRKTYSNLLSQVPVGYASKESTQRFPRVMGMEVLLNDYVEDDQIIPMRIVRYN